MSDIILSGDNLNVMASLEKETVDLVLTDPPYNTSKPFIYKDAWSSSTDWLTFMTPRIKLMRDLLKPQGVMAICIDHHELFNLGRLMDDIFGKSNMIGIINWQKCYAPNKVETAELLSKMAGTTTVYRQTRSYSGKRFGMQSNVSISEQETQRPLLTADETMRLPPDDMLIFVAGHSPIYGRKIKYYADKELLRRASIPARDKSLTLEKS